MQKLPFRLTTLRSVGLALVLAGTMLTAVAVAAVGDTASSKVLHACVREDGTMRLTSDISRCRNQESSVSWNVNGPQGPVGPTGPMGSTDVTVHLAQPTPQPASASAYLKFDGIDGEAQDKDHKGWSDILSISMGMDRPSAARSPGSGAVSGQVQLSDIEVVKELDKSSPKLMEAVASGKVFPKVEIHLARAGADGSQSTYYAYTLKNVMVTSYQFGGSSSDAAEHLSLNFEEIKVTYFEYDQQGKQKGQVEFSWKVEEGKS